MKTKWRDKLNKEFSDCDVSLLQRIDTFITENFTHKENTRSLQQNKYYFGVVIRILSEELGYTDIETHDALKMKFLSTGMNRLPTTRTTTDMTTQEFETYLE